MKNLLSDIIELKENLKKKDFTFNPVISPKELQKIEVQFEISLPEEYSLFIQHIGNGGDGPPEYGLKPIGTDEGWWFPGQRNSWLEFENIKKPFPFSEQWIWEDDEADLSVRQEQIFDGNIYLGTDGCGMDWALIVSGPQRGFVWQFTDVGISPCRPPMRFLEWFKKWLEAASIRQGGSSSEDLFWWTV